MMISDLDGTLIDKQRNITKKTKYAVEAFKTNGGIFSIATGRGINSAKRYIDQLNIDVPVILFNGCVIYKPSNHEIIYQNCLKKELYLEIIKLWETGRYDVDLVVFGLNGIYIKKRSHMIDVFLDIDNEYAKIQEDLTKIEDPIKVLLLGDAQISRRLVDELKSEFKVPFSCVQSDDVFIEILPNGVTKGTALKKLSDIMKISMDEIVAVGDQDNDRDMIMNAGLGVAMANADESVKSNADFVTKTNMQDGVAYLIRKVLDAN